MAESLAQFIQLNKVDIVWNVVFAYEYIPNNLQNHVTH